jgi:hypothetical protein
MNTFENWFTFDYGVERVMGELARRGNQFVDEVSALNVESETRFFTLSQ